MPKNKTNKRVTAILALLLITLFAAGATLAYVLERTDTSKNTFVPVYVDSAPANTAGGISVTNTGEATAYLRAAIVISWVSVDGEGNPTGHYHSATPVEGVDYSIDYDSTGAWLLRSDGFWYHRTPVGAGATAEVLIKGITRLTNPPEGYRLSVEILSTGLQASPTKVVEQTWGVTLEGVLITN